MSDFFLSLIGDTTVWCSEHDAPVVSWEPGPAFTNADEAKVFIETSREWYDKPDGPKHCLFKHPEGWLFETNKTYVVDVLVPISTVVHAPDENTAAGIALERLTTEGVIQRIHQMVDDDDSSFVPSDSAAQTEVGEA